MEKNVSKNAYFCAFFITFYGRVILPDCLQANFNEFHNFLFLKFYLNSLQEMVLKSPYENVHLFKENLSFLEQSLASVKLDWFCKTKWSHLAFLQPHKPTVYFGILCLGMAIKSYLQFTSLQNYPSPTPAELNSLPFGIPCRNLADFSALSSTMLEDKLRHPEYKYLTVGQLDSWLLSNNIFNG